MTPAETAIREALAAGPTFWKCKACGSTSEVSGAIVGDNWCNSCGACDTMEGFAACSPAAMAELLAELDRLRAALEVSEAASKAAVQKAQRQAVTNSELNTLCAENEALRTKIASAYGYLWLANNDPDAPHQYPPERAAYEARKCLRGTLTKEQRGEAINAALLAVRAAIDAAKGGE